MSIGDLAGLILVYVTTAGVVGWLAMHMVRLVRLALSRLGVFGVVYVLAATAMLILMCVNLALPLDRVETCPISEYGCVPPAGEAVR